MASSASVASAQSSLREELSKGLQESATALLSTKQQMDETMLTERDAVTKKLEAAVEVGLHFSDGGAAAFALPRGPASRGSLGTGRLQEGGLGRDGQHQRGGQCGQHRPSRDSSIAMLSSLPLLSAGLDGPQDRLGEELRGADEGLVGASRRGLQATGGF